MGWYYNTVKHINWAGLWLLLSEETSHKFDYITIIINVKSLEMRYRNDCIHKYFSSSYHKKKINAWNLPLSPFHHCGTLPPSENKGSIQSRWDRLWRRISFELNLTPRNTSMYFSWHSVNIACCYLLLDFFFLS